MFSHFLLLLCYLISFSIQLPFSRRALSNGPVISSDFPDPSFLNVGGTYYAFATTNGQQNIQSATSPDFATWTVTGQDALPNLPSWSNGASWAPDVIQLADGTFLMYFTALYTNSSMMHCLGTATSTMALGPYKASDTPLACPLDVGGAIDPSSFIDTDGTRYVVYKVDGNSLGGGGTCGNGDESHGTPIMLQALEADGVTPSGEPVQILDRDANDGPLVEAPYLVLHEGTYVLFFSSNCFNGPYYDTSYATATAINGPYTKAGSPLLASGGNNGAFNSPGGASIGGGGTQMVFHSDQAASDASVRQMWTAGITIDGTTVSIS
ncbi:hypothetical protein ACLMJK_004226 [Lecanora helva]